MKTSITLFLALSLLLVGFARSQEAQNSDLHRQILALDTQLFERGFNQCELSVFETVIALDMEFFHDISGTQNREQFILAVQKNICSGSDRKPIRTLLSASTQVFALKNNGELYGAIQHGIHRFHTQSSEPSDGTYTDARFTHLWLLRNGQWQLKNSLSYDHRQKTTEANAATEPADSCSKTIDQTTAKNSNILQLTVGTLSFGIYQDH